MSCKCGNNKKKCNCSDTGCHSSGKSCESFEGGFSGVNGCDVYYSGCPVEKLKIRKGHTFDDVVKILTDEMFRRDCEYVNLLKAYNMILDNYDQVVKKLEDLSDIVNENNEEGE